MATNIITEAIAVVKEVVALSLSGGETTEPKAYRPSTEFGKDAVAAVQAKSVFEINSPAP